MISHPASNNAPVVSGTARRAILSQPCPPRWLKRFLQLRTADPGRGVRRSLSGRGSDCRPTINSCTKTRKRIKYPTKLMKTLLTLATAALIAISPAALAEEDSSKEIRNTSVVDSGTYTVIAQRVDPDEKEIYVKTDDGKILELYFKDDTKLSQDGKNVSFSELKKGQRLEIKVEKIGNHLKPLAVVILDTKTE
jgi:cold shock protein